MPGLSNIRKLDTVRFKTERERERWEGGSLTGTTIRKFENCRACKIVLLQSLTVQYAATVTKLTLQRKIAATAFLQQQK